MKKIIFSLFLFGSLVLVANSFVQQEEENIGKNVFEETCESCHTGGFKGWMTGAPEIGDLDDWEEYFKKDLSVLVTNVNEGTKGHAVKGECEECTEEQIKAAIKYIIAETKKGTNN